MPVAVDQIIAGSISRSRVPSNLQRLLWEEGDASAEAFSLEKRVPYRLHAALLVSYLHNDYGSADDDCGDQAVGFSARVLSKS
jgi:hypothetical protein